METGLILDYWNCDPRLCIVKLQGELTDNMLKLRGLVNIKQSGEIHFDDSAELGDGDSVYCEPDGLVVLRAGGIESQIEPINGQLVQIGTYFDGTFIAHPTQEYAS